MNNKISGLENKINIEFKDKELIRVAITHSSYAREKKNVKYNERLEFLGDSVLQLCITEYLFETLKDKLEGELTKIRSIIVCETSLFDIAKKWDLGKYIILSKGEELTGGRHRVSIQADCVEAIIAAVYLDKGIDVANKFIMDNFSYIIDKAIKNEIVLDYKTKLQETLQKNSDVNIKYNLIKSDGPAHRRKFFISVDVNSQHLGTGIGYSKKEAEQFAAKEALIRMEGKRE
jgi:ribonuclease-3